MTALSCRLQSDILMFVLLVGACAKFGIALSPFELLVTSCLGNSSTSDTTSTQNCSSIASSLTWWNMSQLGAVEITRRAFVVPLPDNFPQVSMFHMWLAAASCHYNRSERNNTVQYYTHVTRVPLYLGAFGGVSVVPQDSFDTIYTRGVAFAATLDQSNVSIRVALAPPDSGGDIVIEYTKGIGCDCDSTDSHCNTTLCLIAIQTRIGKHGDRVGLVVKNVDPAFVTKEIGDVSVGLVASGWYSLLNTAVNGTLGDQLLAAGSAANPVEGARYLSFQRDDTMIDVCLAAATCEECLSLVLPEEKLAPCSFAFNLNTYGVCLPLQLALQIDSTTRYATRHFECVTFANVSMFGPCFRSMRSCAVQHSTPLEAAVPEAEGHSSQSRTMLTIQQYLDIGIVTGCTPSHLLTNATCPPSVITLRAACPVADELTVSFFSTGGSDASSAVLHVPLRCTEAILSWRTQNLTYSRWCLPPYVHDRYCNVTTLVATVTAFTYVVQYFHRSGVVAVHALAQSGINVSRFTTMSTIFLESASSETVQSSRYFLWAPNRSTYFVSGYSCLGECVHGTCDDSGSCICTNPTQWIGPSCDVLAGIFYVHSLDTSSGVSAECPICAHGNCSESGMCICDEGHGGPRCELNCNTAPTYTCPAVTSLAVCATCACFAGTASNASNPVCFPLAGCTFSYGTGTLLSTSMCPDASTSNGSTRSTAAPPQSRTTQQTSSPWTRTNALAVILALCVSAVLLSVFMQLLSFRRRARRAGKVRKASNAGPMEGVRQLLPAPQLVSP
jgi:hypothetical protein